MGKCQGCGANVPRRYVMERGRFCPDCAEAEFEREKIKDDAEFEKNTSFGREVGAMTYSGELPLNIFYIFVFIWLAYEVAKATS